MFPFHRVVRRLLIRIVATLGFSGYVPIAPGTAGSAVTAVFYYFFLTSVGTLAWIFLLLLCFFVAVFAAGNMETEWGRDPAAVVADEGVGYLVTVVGLPHGLWTAVAGFLVFRVLDIIKPPPARQLEALPGGWGVVLDDVAAGIYANGILHIGLLAYPAFHT